MRRYHSYTRRERVIDHYITMVIRDPKVTNVQIAHSLGMKTMAFESALYRARRDGLLNIRRDGHGSVLRIKR